MIASGQPRVCIDCQARLSRYNRSRRCWPCQERADRKDLEENAPGLAAEVAEAEAGWHQKVVTKPRDRAATDGLDYWYPWSEEYS